MAWLACRLACHWVNQISMWKYVRDSISWEIVKRIHTFRRRTTQINNDFFQRNMQDDRQPWRKLRIAAIEWQRRNGNEEVKEKWSISGITFKQREHISDASLCIVGQTFSLVKRKNALFRGQLLTYGYCIVIFSIHWTCEPFICLSSDVVYPNQ